MSVDNRQLLVWDLPVRLLHCLLAACAWSARSSPSSSAVTFYSLVVKKPLVRPMIHGRAVDGPDVEPARRGGPLALLVALAIAAVAVWIASGELLPPPPELLPTQAGKTASAAGGFRRLGGPTRPEH